MINRDEVETNWSICTPAHDMPMSTSARICSSLSDTQPRSAAVAGL